MKIKSLIIGLVLIAMLLIIMAARAGITVIAGSGLTIPANSTTNIPVIVQVAVVPLNNKFLYLQYGSCTNPGGMIVSSRLTLDGTNYVNSGQSYTNSQTGATNDLWSPSNMTVSLYGELSISNSTGQAISNFTATLQQ